MQQMTAASAVGLPPPIKRSLKASCDGDWSRVVADDDGTYTVYNSPAQASRAVEQHRSPAAPPPPATPQPPTRPSEAPEHDEQPQVLDERPTEADSEPSVTDSPSVTEAPEAHDAPAEDVPEPAPAATPEPEPVRRLPDLAPRPAYTAEPDEPITGGKQWRGGDPQDVDWANVDLDMAASKLRDKLANGLPAHIPFEWHPSVLALQGMDLEIVETALRNPKWVDIRPETAVKHYPVLGFHRGDVTTVLGLRTPTHPAVISAFVSPLLEHDTHQVNHTGGGGKRRQDGLPRTVSAMLAALRAHGVLVDVDPLENTSEVMYRGQRLGKITTGPSAPRKTVESDYQRIVRKVDAINRREASKAAG